VSTKEIEIDPATDHPIAGDTVLYTAINGAVFGGVVEEVHRDADGYRFRIVGHEGLFFHEAEAWRSRTISRPAPEPEPDWKPGTVAVVEVNGTNTYRAIRNDEGQWDAESCWTYSDDEVSDVRPLVVIDPTSVDVVELAKAAWDRWDGAPATDSSNAHFRDIVRAVLTGLGLEEAR